MLCLTDWCSGVYKTIAPLASTELISDIKGRRSGSLQGLRMSWKLHKLLEHNLCCVRQQEVTKAGEFVAQIAVQFITEQVRRLVLRLPADMACRVSKCATRGASCSRGITHSRDG